MIGDSHYRIGGDRLASGAGRFVADVRVEGMLHAAVLRSRHAHARLGLDRRQAGPRAARRAARCSPPPTCPRRAIIPNRVGAPPGTERYLQPAIARGVVRYVGEPVALVVADDRYTAEDALERIDVVYDPLPACASVADALAPGAPRLFPGTESNNVAVIPMRVGDADRGARHGRRGRPRALHLSAPDRGGARDARPRRRPPRPARRRAAPDRLDQVHPHQPHHPGPDLRHPRRRAAPDGGGRGRGLRRPRRAVSGRRAGPARRDEARPPRPVDRGAPRGHDVHQPRARGRVRRRDRLRRGGPHRRHARADARGHRRVRAHRRARAVRVRRGALPRPVSRAQLPLRSLVGRHQQDAGGHAALARAARVQSRPRAADGRGRGPPRPRSRRDPPAQSHPRGRDAVRLRHHVVRRQHGLRLRRLPRALRRAAAPPRLRPRAGRPGGAQCAPGSAARHRARRVRGEDRPRAVRDRARRGARRRPVHRRHGRGLDGTGARDRARPDPGRGAGPARRPLRRPPRRYLPGGERRRHLWLARHGDGGERRAHGRDQAHRRGADAGGGAPRPCPRPR